MYYYAPTSYTAPSSTYYGGAYTYYGGAAAPLGYAGYGYSRNYGYGYSSTGALVGAITASVVASQYGY